MMYVVGATKANMFAEVRTIVPNHFLLVPGVGAQGGDLDDVCKHGIIKNDIGLLINSSRAIIYASNEEDFAEAAAAEAKKMADQMKVYVA
jgi:orotidine-5'-phosphate decarboxylase